jgi:hypothetical protein
MNKAAVELHQPKAAAVLAKVVPFPVVAPVSRTELEDLARKWSMLCEARESLLNTHHQLRESWTEIKGLQSKVLAERTELLARLADGAELVE